MILEDQESAGVGHVGWGVEEDIPGGAAGHSEAKSGGIVEVEDEVWVGVRDIEAFGVVGLEGLKVNGEFGLAREWRLMGSPIFVGQNLWFWFSIYFLFESCIEVEQVISGNWLRLSS